MKRIVLMVLCLLFVSTCAYAGDSKESLTLKRDLSQERVLRIAAELELMRSKFIDGQQLLQAEKKNLDSLNASLKALEAPGEKEKKK